MSDASRDDRAGHRRSLESENPRREQGVALGREFPERPRLAIRRRSILFPDGGSRSPISLFGNTRIRRGIGGLVVMLGGVLRERRLFLSL